MRRTLILIAIALLSALWLGNTSLFHQGSDTPPRLIAHRGVHQVYTGPRDAKTCRAMPVPLSHAYIENTLPSMRAAFDLGADVVEIDLHLTTDGQFAVFHDWTLDCLTNGSGVTHDQSLAALQALDIAHNWSRDGQSFPLRGTGIGLLPSLDQVLAARPGPLLLNFKSNDPAEGRALVPVLSQSDKGAQIWGIYGGQGPTRSALSGLSTHRGFDKPGLKSCLLRYIALGWSGHVPAACRNAIVAVPMDYGPYLWGWPHRFTARMQAAGSEVILWGPYDGSGFSSGIDDLETLSRVPLGFDGYLWTNRIELIGPAVQARLR